MRPGVASKSFIAFVSGFTIKTKYQIAVVSEIRIHILLGICYIGKYNAAFSLYALGGCFLNKMQRS